MKLSSFVSVRWSRLRPRVGVPIPRHSGRGPGPGNPRRNQLPFRGAATPPELIGAKGPRRRGLGPERPSGRTLAACRRRAAPQPRRSAERAAHAAAVDARPALIGASPLRSPRSGDDDRQASVSPGKRFGTLAAQRMSHDFPPPVAVATIWGGESASSRRKSFAGAEHRRQPSRSSRRRPAALPGCPFAKTTSERPPVGIRADWKRCGRHRPNREPNPHAVTGVSVVRSVGGRVRMLDIGWLGVCG